MFAFLIIALVLCSILAVFDLAMVVVSDSDAGGMGFLNLLALVPAIIALAIMLASR